MRNKQTGGGRNADKAWGALKKALDGGSSDAVRASKPEPEPDVTPTNLLDTAADTGRPEVVDTGQGQERDRVALRYCKPLSAAPCGVEGPMQRVLVVDDAATRTLELCDTDEPSSPRRTTEQGMRLTVIGSGYVGLVAGACFSSVGNDVTMVDRDASKIEVLRGGGVPIYEPGLVELVTDNHTKGRLHFTTELAPAVRNSDVVFLAVGTPSAPDGSVDLGALEGAAREVAAAVDHPTVVVTKSTVPVGTQARLTALFDAEAASPVDVVANPEFLKQGAAVGDFLKPDRVIVGSESPRAISLMRQLYAPFMHRSERLLVMDPASAELTKYACNAMLATRISFMNELSQLCDAVGADISRIRAGMGTDHRIGPDFLYASLGYGGSCFPKDVQALVHLGEVYGAPQGIAASTRAANDRQRQHMVDRILGHFDGALQGRRIGVWGLAFKAKTDDVRESAALHVVQRLVEAGATVSVHDPQARDTARAVLGETVRYCEEAMEVLDEADALVVCTEWREYRMPDPRALAEHMRGRVVFDGRNLYDLELFADTGFTYVSVGRPTVG